MKKLTVFIIGIFLIIASTFAQSPKSFKYQAVVRDNSGTLLANHIVNFRISLLKGGSTGTAVYVETQKDTTNQFGLANLKIGSGTLVSGNFANINWGGDTYFVKIELDPNGNTAFTFMGTSQLLSVPYALYSEKSGDEIWEKSASSVFLSDTSLQVGIGNTNPSCGLEISKFKSFNTWHVMLQLTNPTDQAITFYEPDENKGWLFGANATSADKALSWKYYTNFLNQTGDVKMQLSPTGLLGVCEIKVASTWCDYVFAKEYKRMSLKELEGYIDCHKHLPNIPSAVDVETNGIYVGDMSKRMMEKIEELTLYIIDLNKSVEQLKAENAELKKKLNRVK